VSIVHKHLNIFVLNSRVHKIDIYLMNLRMSFKYWPKHPNTLTVRPHRVTFFSLSFFKDFLDFTYRINNDFHWLVRQLVHCEQRQKIITLRWFLWQRMTDFLSKRKEEEKIQVQVWMTVQAMVCCALCTGVGLSCFKFDFTAEAVWFTVQAMVFCVLHELRLDLLLLLNWYFKGGTKKGEPNQLN
jgi:hypothetical protein